MTLRSHGGRDNLLSLSLSLSLEFGSPLGHAGRSSSHPGPAEAQAELVLPAAYLLVVRPPGHTDALSNPVAFMLHLVNSSSSSSKGVQQWNILSATWLTGQAWCWDIPAFDYRSALLSVTVHASGFPFSSYNLWFSHGTFPVTQWSCPPLQSNFSSPCASLPAGCITPKSSQSMCF